jgi:HlyD family secretion protein
MTITNTEKSSDISRALGIGRPGDRGRNLKQRLGSGALVLLAIALLTVLWRTAGNSNAPQYETDEVRRGNLTVTVTATGNLEPTNQVDVGTEVSGTIAVVEVDYNDLVKVGQVLARLDTSKLEAQVLQSRAALEASRARVLEAQATVLEALSHLARLKQVRELSGGKVPSQHELDAGEAALKRAQADEISSKAAVSEAEATLDVNETDLSKAVIRSPINGIVLERAVDPGQTVAASLQTPVLFTLAEDLTRMELHVDVDEADVGQVTEGQEAAFTVDAYPDRTFPARIIQVRYGSQEVDGVITYEAVLNVDNSDLFLRPGMTATADITVKKLEDALLVPNAALRFTPQEQEENRSRGGSLIGSLLPRPPALKTRKREASTNGQQQRVWMLRQERLVPVSVTAGATDGIMTEVLSGHIQPGTALVTDMLRGGR